MFTDRKPWESKYAHMPAKDLTEIYEEAMERDDWKTLAELQQPFVSGEPPAGFGYREQSDFRDRR